jgi:glycerol-3-phosphate acyltransferase PlsY
MDVGHYALTIVFGYLLGAIPSGLIVGKLVKGIDLREFGSGKTGATNALRTLGKGPAVLVIVLDVVKGLIAILLAHIIVGSAAAACLAGLAAAIGHNWPVYAGFRGGRGVLVSFAMLYTICWPAAICATFVGVALIAVSKMVSFGVLIGTVAAIVATVPFVVSGTFVTAGGLLIIARHRDNIARLRAGTERKLGQSAVPLA